MFNNIQIKRLDGKINAINNSNNKNTEKADNNYLTKCKITGSRRDNDRNLYLYAFVAVNPDDTINPYGICGTDAICINEIGKNPENPSVENDTIVMIQSSINGYEFNLGGGGGGTIPVGKLDPLLDLTIEDNDNLWWVSNNLHTLNSELSITFSNSAITTSKIDIYEFDKKVGEITLTFSNITQTFADNKYNTTGDFTGQVSSEISEITTGIFDGNITIKSDNTSGIETVNISGKYISPEIESENVSFVFNNDNKLIFENEHTDKAVKVRTLIRMGMVDNAPKFIYRDEYYDSLGNLVKVDIVNDTITETALHIHAIPIITNS